MEINDSCVKHCKKGRLYILTLGIFSRKQAEKNLQSIFQFCLNISTVQGSGEQKNEVFLQWNTDAYIMQAIWEVSQHEVEIISDHVTLLL